MPTPPAPDPKCKPEVRNAPVMPGKTLASKIIKPVGAAVLLLASLAHGQTVISAPMGQKPASLPDWCAAAASVGAFNVQCPPYNAVGNGVADDTVPLQRAASDCEQGGGGTILVPDGTYLAGQFTVGSHCTFQGAGIDATTIRCKTTEPNVCIHASAGGKLALGGVSGSNNYGNAVSSVTFRDFTLNAQGVARQTAALGGYVRGLVVAHNSDHVIIQRVRLVDGGSRALEVNPSHQIKVLDSFCENSSHKVGFEGDCLHIGDPCGVPRAPPGWCNTTAKILACSDITISRNTVMHAGDTAIAASECTDVVIADNHILGDESFACTVDADCGGGGATCNIGSGICAPTIDESCFDLTGTSRARIHGNECNHIRNTCVLNTFFTDTLPHSWAPTDVNVSENSCIRNTVTVTNNESIFMSGLSGTPADNMIASLNTIQNSPVASILFNTAMTSGAITGNVITNAGTQQTGAAGDAAILIGATTGSDAKGIIVTGNFITGVPAKMSYGIFEQYTGAAGGLIASNIVNNAASAVVRARGSASEKVMEVQSVTQAALAAGSTILSNPAAGSRIYCSNCTYDGTTGLCNTGGTGAAGRPAYKRDAVDGNWCCASGGALTTCQ